MNARSRIKTMRKIAANEERTGLKGLEELRRQVTELEFENREIENKIKEKERVGWF